ncbi:MAG TPA: hypothetical protein PLO51_04930, partial [Candidatus Micrarchaeota archaeon]|nr:hypothetical protein [Candidatus Micrarchaeota archaeon]
MGLQASASASDAHEISDTYAFFLASFSVADMMYKLSSQPIGGKPEFKKYVDDFLEAISPQIEIPMLANIPAHFFAWHYMQKYSGDMPSIEGFIDSIREYMESDFKPWGLVAVSQDGFKYNYGHRGAKSEFPEIEVKVEKSMSAGAILNACLHARCENAIAYRYEMIMAAKAAINRANVKILKEIVEKTANAEQDDAKLENWQKRMVAKIAGVMLDNYEIGLENAHMLYHVSKVLSYVWMKGKPINLENVLSQIAMFPDDITLYFLKDISKGMCSSKAMKSTGKAIEDLERNRSVALDMAAQAFPQMPKNAKLVIVKFQKPGPGKTVETGGEGKQIKLK